MSIIQPSHCSVGGGGGMMGLTEGFYSIFFEFSAFIASAITFVSAVALKKFFALLALFRPPKSLYFYHWHKFEVFSTLYVTILNSSAHLWTFSESRVGHPVLLRSERIVLFCSFKE